ncbi:15530_t:CDS:1, partial [Entrophospora sp. SA101]
IEVLQEEENDSLNELLELYDTDVQSTEHPAINSDGKWKLETILKNNIP